MKNKSVKVLLGAMTVLLLAWGLESCSKKDNPSPTAVDKTALTAEITLATNLLSTTTEGTGNGEYIKGSKAILTAAIATAQSTASSSTATAGDVTNALAQLTAAVTTYQGSVIVPVDQADLVGQWTFDELTATTVGTTVKDYSSLGNNGTIQAGAAYFSTTAGLPYADYVTTSNIPTLTTDRYGVANKALHFTQGANVQIPYSTSLNPGAITIALWAKPDSLKKYWPNNYMVSMNRWNTYKFQLQEKPILFFTAYLKNASTADSVDYDEDQHVGQITPANAWYHFAVTLGNGHEIFYINGIQIQDWSSANSKIGAKIAGTIVNLNNKTSVKFSPVDLVIGQDLPTSKYTQDPNSPFYVNYGAYFIGAMDEVRIYKTALSASQITAIYNQEKP